MKNSLLFRILFPKAARLPPRTNGWYGDPKLIRSADGQPPPDDVTIKPFRINISQTELDDLKQRLNNARYCQSLHGTDFRFGFNSQSLENVVHYWKHQYDWRKCESHLNQYDQYKTQIEGLNIHYVHIKPKNPKGIVLPLLMLHGWPGSFFEFYKSFQFLTDPNFGKVSFEVIVPSNPGYGFSDAPQLEGFNLISSARIFVKLMNRLGFDRFYVHGGDWGAVITKTMAVLYPEHIKGIHSTFFINSAPQGKNIFTYFLAKYMPFVIFGNQKSQQKLFQELNTIAKRWYIESGYYHMHSTKPDSIGFALTDSPIGLAAYILEKYSTWNNPDNVNKPDGGLTEKFTLDELLTVVMIYWFSKNITPSLRFYKENLCPERGVVRKFNLGSAIVPPSVPVGYAVFPHEMLRIPKFIAEMAFPNLVQYTVMPVGGHFGAFEEPKLLAEDLLSFVNKVES